MPDSKAVIPLESNPEIFSELATKLGLSPVLEFHDIYSITEPDLLAFLPQPLYGVIMLFPLTAKFEEYRRSQDVNKGLSHYSTGVNWFKQTISNGCGLYALLHILSNIPRDLIIENSLLGNFLAEIRDLPENEVPQAIERLENRINLDANFGSQGQTEAPDAGSETIFHFITFVRGENGHLYELDGRRAGPIDLGECPEHVLANGKIAEKFQFYLDMADEANKMNFSLMGLGPAQ